MASTYTAQDLIDTVVNRDSRGAQKGALACDMALRMAWEAWPWRQRKVDLPPFWLIPERQDYGAPFSAVPTDFGQLWTAQLRRITDDGNKIVLLRDLRVLEELPVNNRVQLPDAISYEPSESAFRLSHQTPSEGVAAPEYYIAGIYLKRNDKITGSNAHTTTLPWDDSHFLELVRVMRWAWSIVQPGSPESIQHVAGRSQAQGLYAEALDAIKNMIEIDGGPKADVITPESSLTEW